MNNLAFNEHEIDLEYLQELYAPYVKYFAQRGIMVDLGCGRGPMLRNLLGAGATVFGIDNDPDMINYLHKNKLPGELYDAQEFLEDNPLSLSGIWCAHVIEHIDRKELQQFFDLCYKAILHGSYCVIVTPNASSVWVHTDPFWKDVTHVAPLHVEAVKFLMETAGFTIEKTETSSPIPNEWKLEKSGDELYDRNIDKLNKLLYDNMDTVVIGRK